MEIKPLKPYWEQDPMVRDYYESEAAKIQKEAVDAKHQIIMLSEIGEIAIKYIGTYEALTKRKCPYLLDELVSHDTLSKDDIMAIQSIDTWAAEKLDALLKHCKEADYLLSQADCYDAKVSILKKYNILTGPITKKETKK